MQHHQNSADNATARWDGAWGRVWRHSIWSTQSWTGANFQLHCHWARTIGSSGEIRGQKLKKTPNHQIYNETFARESRRLQDEEEEQVNREIDQFIAKFPKIFSLPKRKELIAQVRELLTNAKSEKYGKLDEGNGWTCFENNDHTYLGTST